MTQKEYDNLSPSDKSEYYKSVNYKTFSYGNSETGQHLLEGLSEEEKDFFKKIISTQADKGIFMKIGLGFYDPVSKELILA
jgi:hypothetical protein